MSNLVESKQKSAALWLTKFNIKDVKVVIKDAKFDAVDSIENSKCSNILIFYLFFFYIIILLMKIHLINQFFNS